MNRTHRRGLTLPEILIAMLVFAFGALALAASAAAVARQSAENAGRYRSFELAQSRIEKISASRCVSGSGTDRTASNTNEWLATLDGALVIVSQLVTRFDSRGSHVDVIESASLCE